MGFSQNFIASAPSSSFGYYRGTPYWGNDGSGKGPDVQGNSAFAAGQGSGGISQTWEPSIPFLLGMVILEMIVFAWLAKKL
jgi:hypothetical protein